MRLMRRMVNLHGSAVGNAAASVRADDAAREANKQQRITMFTRALQNMKTLAEGGTLPPAPARGGGPGGPGRGGAPGGSPPAGAPGRAN